MTDDTRRVIRIPRGEQLIKWELARTAPAAGRYEGIDIQFTIHSGLRRWMEQMAKDALVGRDQPVHVHACDDGDQRSQPQRIKILDGHGDEAWNLNMASYPSRNMRPSLRLDHDWTQHLGFLRLCVHALTRKLQITMSDRENAQALWSPEWCAVRNKEVPHVDACLLQSVEHLRTTHISWPKTVKTTVVLAAPPAVDSVAQDS